MEYELSTRHAQSAMRNSEFVDLLFVMGMLLIDAYVFTEVQLFDKPQHSDTDISCQSSVLARPVIGSTRTSSPVSD